MSSTFIWVRCWLLS